MRKICSDNRDHFRTRAASFDHLVGLCEKAGRDRNADHPRCGQVEDQFELGWLEKFRGDVLLVESQHDTIVPSSVTANYRTAFGQARSLTFRVIEGADHALSDPDSQNQYTSLLTNWATEVISKSRGTT